MKRSPSLAMPSAVPLRRAGVPAAQDFGSRHQAARAQAVRRLDRVVRFWSVVRLVCPWRWEAITALREENLRTLDRLHVALRQARA